MVALPEAVVFDLDGVLTRTDRYHYLETLGADPRQCIGVEDAAVGVRAIKAAGMYAIGVGDSALLKEADEVIQDLEEFRLDRYLKGQR